MTGMQVPSKVPFWPNFFKITGGGGAKAMYHITAQPPYVTIQEGQHRYKIQVDGSTFMEAVGMSVPLPACRHTKHLLMLRRLVAVRKNHTVFLILAVLVAALFFLQFTVSDAEMRASYLTVFAFWASLVMNLTLFVLACITALVLVVWNFGKGVRLSWNRSQADLPMMIGPGDMDISPDILVTSEPHETSAEYAARCLDAIRGRMTNQQWVIMIPMRSGIIQIQEADQTVTTVRRNNLKSGLEDWPEEITKMESFTYETKYEYDRYISRFCSMWPEYARALKVRTETPGASLSEMLETIVNVGQKTALLFALVLFAVPAFSQPKSVQVSQYLGAKNSAVVPPSGGEVVFKFQSGKEVNDIRRTADGKNNLIGLLKSPATYTDADNMGKLIAITHKGQTIRPMPKPVETVTMEVEAKPLFDEMPGNDWGASIQDSAGTAQQIKRIENDIIRNSKAIERWSLQWWGSAVMDWAFYIVLMIIGFFRFCAQSAFNESRMNRWGDNIYGRTIMNIGLVSSSITFVFALLALGLLLLMVFWRLFSGGIFGALSIFFSWKIIMVAVWYLIIEGFGRIMDHIVPNPQVMEGGGSGVVVRRDR